MTKVSEDVEVAVLTSARHSARGGGSTCRVTGGMTALWNGDMNGATLVANINVPWSVNPAYVGIPTYQDHGGGNSSQNYDSTSLARYAAGVMPLQRISYQQLR